MDFGSAVKLMKQGVKVTRTEWNNQDEHVYLEGRVFMKHGPEAANPFPIIFFSHEVLATDWEVVRQHNESEGSGN